MALEIDLLDSTPILKHTYDIFLHKAFGIFVLSFIQYYMYVLPNLSSDHTNMKFTN